MRADTDSIHNLEGGSVGEWHEALVGPVWRGGGFIEVTRRCHVSMGAVHLGIPSFTSTGKLINDG